MIKRGTWAEISLDNIKHNLEVVKSSLKDNTKVCCVVKADAYGHGAVEVSKMVESNGADYLSVARFEEAMELRENGIKLPILCMGYTCECDISEAVKNNITLTVYSYDMARLIDKEAYELNIEANIHIKIDTGMSRIGFLPNITSLNEIYKINKMKNINIEGIYTHFAKADEADKDDTYTQLLKFKKIVSELEKKDVMIPLKHVSNTAATIDLKELGFNMVRLGIGLYGCYPSENVSKDVDLKPAMTLKTRVTNIKTVKAGTKVSYGYTHEFEKDTKVATLAIGYADGFDRTQKSPKVKIKGVLCNVVGRICMDQCMVEIPESLSVGMEAEVLVMGNESEMRVEDLAARRGTINYEVLCSVSRRVSRIYKFEGKSYRKSYL